MIAKMPFRGLAACAFSIVWLASISTAQAGVGDTVTTPKKIPSQIQISTGSNGSAYYIQVDGGWGATNCGGALYAYINTSTPGSDAVLSAALTARSSGKPISVAGICGDSTGQPQYIQIQTIFF